MKRIEIFALEPDLRLILQQIESKQALTYTSAGSMPTPELRQWSHYVDIENMGTAEGAQTALCRAYLIVRYGTAVHAERIDQYDGKTRFDVDQLLNPNSIVFTPAGEWKRSMIIAGLFGTASSTIESQALMRLVSAAIKKSFTKIKSYWVGPQALLRFRSGFRLTMSEHSPEIYNLRESN